MSSVYLGIDVAKKDFCVANSQKALRVLANTNEGFRLLIELLQKYEQPHVILEASGGYERVLTDALHDAGITVSVVQPGCVRHFAKSLKVLAKTDAIDATVIARFGEATSPKPSEKTPLATRRLRALSDRRTQLIEDRTREKNRLGCCPDRLIATEIKRRIKQLSGVIEKLDHQVQELIAKEADLAAKANTLQTATGVGTQTTSILLAHLPELGTLSRQATAAIAGLAPHPQESGSWTGKRRIYGGRKIVRKALYMAAMSAAKHCPHLAPFFQKLRAKNKAYNVALIAVAPCAPWFSAPHQLTDAPESVSPSPSPQPSPPMSVTAHESHCGRGRGRRSTTLLAPISHCPKTDFGLRITACVGL